MQYLDRSTLANWVKYMAHNPQYFSYVFRVPLTEANLEAAAVQIFGKYHVLWEPTQVVRYYKPKRAPMLRGICSVCAHLGLGKSQVYFLERHGNLPVWREDGKMVGYVGMLERYARTKHVGRFNGR